MTIDLKPLDRVLTNSIWTAPYAGTVLRVNQNAGVVIIVRDDEKPGALHYGIDVRAAEELGFDLGEKLVEYRTSSYVEPIIDLKTPPGTKVRTTFDGKEYEAVVLGKGGYGDDDSLLCRFEEVFGFSSYLTHPISVAAARKLNFQPEIASYRYISPSKLTFFGHYELDAPKPSPEPSPEAPVQTTQSNLPPALMLFGAALGALITAASQTTTTARVAEVEFEEPETTESETEQTA